MNSLETTLKSVIRNIPDFPKKGVQFKDITTALKNNVILKEIVDTLYEKYKYLGITQVVGIESRGFIIGSILAYKLNTGFVLLRKSGKLPAETFSVEYNLEYGNSSIEIHKDALNENDIVLLHDDLLATGGSSAAAIELINLFHVKEIHANFLIELDELKGRDKIKNINSLNSLIHY